MAITFIYAVKSTGGNSIDYDIEDKVMKIEKKENENSLNEDSVKSLNYVMRDKKGNLYKLSEEYLKKMENYISYDENNNITFKTLSTSQNCSLNGIYKQWQQVRDLMNSKNGNSGNLQYCIVQNFGTDLDPQTANEIGVKFAQEYLSDYQVVVSTHINTGYVHNHIEFNATSFLDGHKFNDCLKTVGEIRQVSDGICREYGLEVLEHTKDFNLCYYYDSKGKLKAFEPTERKNEIKQQEGMYANANDYRNTEIYKDGVEYENSHIVILQNDMDRLIPYSMNYEELLEQLHNVGYEIKDKTKNGEWRKHISFKLDDWGKAVRDSSLDEFYHRTNLSKYLEDNKQKVSDKIVEQVSDVADFSNADIYVYGRIIIEDIDEDFRYKKKGSQYEKVERTEVEKYIIKDTKAMNSEINSIVKNSIFAKSDRLEFTEGTKRENYLINCINDNLHTLKFVEDKNIQSFQQINDIVKTLCEKRNIVYNQVGQISNALKMMNNDISLINKYNDLKQTIISNSINSDYVTYEKKNDEALLKSFEEKLKEKKLLSNEKQKIYIEKYREFQDRFKILTQSLERINKSIDEYDRCVKNIGSVDRKYENKYTNDINNYFETKKSMNNKQRER